MPLQTLQQTKYVNLLYFLFYESRRSPGGAAALWSECVRAGTGDYTTVVQVLVMVSKATMIALTTPAI